MKDVTLLTIADFRTYPVWKFTGSDARGETLVRPVKRLPVKSLGASLVGVDVVLSCGQKVFAMIGNVSVDNPKLTEHFVTLSFYPKDGAIFHLSRYFDFDYAQHGPKQFAAVLGLKTKDIFPISWDVSAVAQGRSEALSGTITEIPRERLSRAEIIALAVPPNDTPNA